MILGLLQLMLVVALAKNAWAEEPAPVLRPDGAPLALEMRPRPGTEGKAKEPARDLVSAIRDFRQHLTDWSHDPKGVCRGLRLGQDTIAIIRLQFD